VTFCLAQRDLWWMAASPLYLLIGTTRHEGAHAAMAFALGGRIIDFSVLPWLWVAEPYLCDVLTFVIGYIWASKIQPASPPLDDVCLAFWCRNKRFNDQLISGESFFCRLSDRDILRVFCLYDSGGSIPDSTNPFLFGTVCAAKQHPMLRFHAVSENSASAVIAGWGEFMNRAFETIKDVGRSGKCDLKSLVVFITTNFTGRHVRTPLLAIVNEGVCSSSERRLITIRREPQ